MNFLNNRTNIWIWRQPFVSLSHGFLRSEENVLYNFETPEGVWENVVSCSIMTFFLKHYLRQMLCLNVVQADVLPGRCYLPYNMW